MNRFIARAFAGLNLVAFCILVAAFVFAGLAAFADIQGASISRSTLIAIMTGLLGLLLAILLCGLTAILVEIMRSLRQIEYLGRVAITAAREQGVIKHPLDPPE